MVRIRNLCNILYIRVWPFEEGQKGVMSACTLFKQSETIVLKDIQFPLYYFPKMSKIRFSKFFREVNI